MTFTGKIVFHLFFSGLEFSAARCLSSIRADFALKLDLGKSKFIESPLR